jgi:hypothetical protein
MLRESKHRYFSAICTALSFVFAEAAWIETTDGFSAQLHPNQ